MTFYIISSDFLKGNCCYKITCFFVLANLVLATLKPTLGFNNKQELEKPMVKFFRKIRLHENLAPTLNGGFSKLNKL